VTSRVAADGNPRGWSWITEFWIAEDENPAPITVIMNWDAAQRK
jgi:hypothetical protein